MTHATHIHGKLKYQERVRLVEETGRGDLAIFEQVDAPYPAFITCPNTPEFVTPIADRSGSSDKNALHIRPEFEKRRRIPKCFHTKKFFQ